MGNFKTKMKQKRDIQATSHLVRTSEFVNAPEMGTFFTIDREKLN